MQMEIKAQIYKKVGKRVLMKRLGVTKLVLCDELPGVSVCYVSDTCGRDPIHIFKNYYSSGAWMQSCEIATLSTFILLLDSVAIIATILQLPRDHLRKHMA